MMQKNNKGGLGRGLGALLNDVEVNQDDKPKVSGTYITEIPLEYIQVNPFQPRSDFDEQALNDLAESIRIHNIIQPITVRKLSNEEYQLISGERRVQASRKIGKQTIPAYIRIANDQEMLEMALVENIQREELNPIEIANSYQRLLVECSLKQEELGDRVGKNRSTVTNYLRLLKLPPEIQVGLRDKKISMGHARAMINIDKIDVQLDLYKQTVEKELSVREVEKLVRELLNTESKPKNIDNQKVSEPTRQQITQIQNKLSTHFGTQVKIKPETDDKGEIKIPYFSADDLERILELLKMS